MDLTRESIEEMKRKIEQSIDDNRKIIITDLNKKGVLSLETIQLLKVVNQGSPLVMEDTKISSTSDKVLLEGLIDFLNDERLEATASFYIIDNQAEIVVDIKLPNDWLIRDAYPNLPHSRMGRENNTGRRESYFYDVRLEEARFLFTSYTHQSDLIKETLQRGLSLYGNLKFHGITAWIEEYVGNQINPTIFGLVDNGDQDATMALRSNLSTLTIPSIPLENSELTFEGKIRSTSNELTIVCISGNIKIIDIFDEIKKIPLAGDLTQEGLNPLQLQEDNLSTTISNLNKLDPIVGGNDLEEILPPGLKHPDSLRIKKMEILFHVPKKAITSVNIVVSTKKSWVIFGGDLVVRRIQFEFNIVSPFSRQRSVTGLVKGVTELPNQVELDMVSEIPYGTLIKGSLTGTISLKEIAEWFLGRSYSVPDLTCSKFQIEIDESKDKQEFNLRANTDEEWEIPFGITTVKVKKVRLDIGGPFNDKREAIIGGEIDIENNLLDISQDVNGDGGFFGRSSVERFSLRSILEKLCGSNIYPIALPDLTLEKMSFEISSLKSRPYFTLKSGVKDFGEIQLIAGIYESQWNFMAALTLAEEWNLSNISDKFKELNFLKVTNAMLMISSFTKPDIIIPGDPSGTKGIKKGLTLRGDLHMRGGGLNILDQLLGIRELKIDTFIPEKVTGTEIRARIDKEFKILAITFFNFNILITPHPNLIVNVTVDANVEMPKDNILRFSGKINIKEGQSEMSLSLQGIWENPFGIKGLTIQKVFLGMKTGPQNAVAVEGSICFDGISVDMAAQFIGSTVPEALIGSSPNTICVSHMIKSFTEIQIPPANFLDVCISKPSVYVVGNLLGVDIGDKHYDPGFRVSGTINQYGIEATAEVAINYEGILLYGEMDKVIIENLLEITGSTPTGGPMVELIVRKQQFLFRLNVHLLVLGISQDTNIIINNKGFYFELVGKIFNVFEAKIQAEASGKLKDGNFHIWATMEDKMLEFMVTETKKMLKDTIISIQTDKDAAEKLEKELKDAVNKIDQEIIKVNKEFNDYKKKLECNYCEAFKKVKELNDHIKPLREKVDRWIEELDKVLGGAISKLKKDIKKAEDKLREWGRELETKIRDRDIYKEMLDNLITPPILKTLEVDKKIRNTELEVASEALKKVARVADKLDTVNKYIERLGENAVLNIDTISFDGKLSDVGYGDVELSITGKFMGGTFDEKIEFNFHDLQTGVTRLYEKLLDKVL